MENISVININIEKIATGNKTLQRVSVTNKPLKINC
jgi:hypothetical protein